MGQEWSRLRKKGSQCVIAPHGAFSKGRKTCRNIFLLKVILKEGREAEQGDGQPTLVGVQPADPRTEPAGQSGDRHGHREPHD